MVVLVGIAENSGLAVGLVARILAERGFTRKRRPD
jgi:hypothetical protein